jgi:hypothetical protein
MQVSIVEHTGTHLIKFIEFLDVHGRPITHYFHTLKLPNISLGISDSLDEAQQKINKAAN